MRKTAFFLHRLRTRAAAFSAIATILVIAVVAGPRLMARIIDHNRAMCGELADSVGLYAGNKVKILDLEVGTITSITNMPDSVRVDFTVPEDLDLPEDEGLITMSDSIVTDRHLELTKPYSGGPRFDGSHCIGLQSTKTPIGISEALSAVSDLSDTILDSKDGEDAANAPGAAAINDSLKATAHALDGMGRPIKQSLQNLAAALGDPDQAEADLRLLLANGQAITAEAIQDWGAIAKLVKALPRTTKFFNDLVGSLALFFENLYGLAPILVDVLERFAPRVYNLADKIVPWVSGVISWLSPQIIWIINQLTPITQWLSVNYRPGWGAFDLTYSPSQGGLPQSMATALCDALRARNVPGIATTCAPGTVRGDGVGLADLLMGAAVR